MVVDKEIFDHPLHILLPEIGGHYLLLLAALKALAAAHLLHARVLRLAGHHYPLVLRCQIHVETLMLLLSCNHITFIFLSEFVISNPYPPSDRLFLFSDNFRWNWGFN